MDPIAVDILGWRDASAFARAMKAETDALMREYQRDQDLWMYGLSDYFRRRRLTQWLRTGVQR